MNYHSGDVIHDFADKPIVGSEFSESQQIREFSQHFDGNYAFGEASNVTETKHSGNLILDCNEEPNTVSSLPTNLQTRYFIQNCERGLTLSDVSSKTGNQPVRDYFPQYVLSYRGSG